MVNKIKEIIYFGKLIYFGNLADLINKSVKFISRSFY